MIDAYKAGIPGNDESFASQHLELAEVELVDREAVKLLTQAEAEGIELRSCPACIREWVANERESSQLLRVVADALGHWRSQLLRRG